MADETERTLFAGAPAAVGLSLLAQASCLDSDAGLQSEAYPSHVVDEEDGDGVGPIRRASAGKSRRGPQKCSRCHQPGHKSRSCIWRKIALANTMHHAATYGSMTETEVELHYRQQIGASGQQPLHAGQLGIPAGYAHPGVHYAQSNGQLCGYGMPDPSQQHLLGASGLGVLGHCGQLHVANGMHGGCWPGPGGYQLQQQYGAMSHMQSGLPQILGQAMEQQMYPLGAQQQQAQQQQHQQQHQQQQQYADPATQQAQQQALMTQQQQLADPNSIYSISARMNPSNGNCYGMNGMADAQGNFAQQLNYAAGHSPHTEQQQQVQQQQAQLAQQQQQQVQVQQQQAQQGVLLGSAMAPASAPLAAFQIAQQHQQMYAQGMGGAQGSEQQVAGGQSPPSFCQGNGCAMAAGAPLQLGAQGQLGMGGQYVQMQMGSLGGVHMGARGGAGAYFVQPGMQHISPGLNPLQMQQLGMQGMLPISLGMEAHYCEQQQQQMHPGAYMLQQPMQQHQQQQHQQQQRPPQQQGQGQQQYGQQQQQQQYGLARPSSTWISAQAQSVYFASAMAGPLAGSGGEAAPPAQHMPAGYGNGGGPSAMAPFPPGLPPGLSSALQPPRQPQAPVFKQGPLLNQLFAGGYSGGGGNFGHFGGGNGGGGVGGQNWQQQYEQQQPQQQLPQWMQPQQQGGPTGGLVGGPMGGLAGLGGFNFGGSFGSAQNQPMPAGKMITLEEIERQMASGRGV